MSHLQESCQSIRDRQRKRSQKTASEGPASRIALLEELKKLLTDNEEAWLEALNSDLRKPPVEAYASELGVLLNEIEHVQNNLSQWMQPKRKRRLLLAGVEKVAVSRRPYGSVLVLSPWNYPLQLALMPVVGALAAGNGVVLKPSEFAPATSQLLAKLVPVYFEETQLAVIEGDETVAKQLTGMEWDFIFFTGSPQTGTKVYEAAAKHLTPVLLELGGKNPCIVDETGWNEETLKQIVWGKFLNAGQSCIAPDTVYVSRPIYEDVLEKLSQQIQVFYGKNPSKSEDFGRLIHTRHFEKVAAFLKDGRVVHGGATAKEELYISPTVLVDLERGSAAATEEIFGPILPVVPYDDLDILLNELSRLSAPLVTYVFSGKEQVVEKIDRCLESGSISHNQVILHSTSPHLPFGGIGKSGIGRYHGEASFQALSVEKARYRKKTFISAASQYPPYAKTGLAALRKFRKRLF